MSKSSGIIIGLPLLLIILIMQVYNLWGWLSRDGWIQYFLMAEVYFLVLISLLYLRSIYRLNNLFSSSITLLLIPAFYFIFRAQEGAIGSMVNSLWYINILISVIASAWIVVLGFGSFFLLREFSRQDLDKKMLLAFGSLISLSALLTYLIIRGQISDSLLIQIWEADKLRTIWFIFEPMLVLSFSLISIYLYLLGKSLQMLKTEYGFMVLLLASSGFEYMINGFGLVSLRSIFYFLGLYSFINLIKNKELVNYFLISIFIILVALHLNQYLAAPNFFTLNIFIPLFHNALIESMKIFLVIYIFIMGWNRVKGSKLEFRLIILLVPIIAYTYTTQSEGNGIHFYDMIAITAMLKFTAAFMVILYSFYYFREDARPKLVSE